MGNLLKTKILAVLTAAMLTSCGNSNAEPVTRTVFAMDTYMTVTAYGENSTPAVDKAVGEIYCPLFQMPQ